MDCCGRDIRTVRVPLCRLEILVYYTLHPSSNNRFYVPGYGQNIDDVVIDGDLMGLKFTAYLCNGKAVEAVVSTTNSTAAFAEYISAGNKLTKIEVQADPTKWLCSVPKGKIK